MTVYTKHLLLVVFMFASPATGQQCAAAKSGTSGMWMAQIQQHVNYLRFNTKYVSHLYMQITMYSKISDM